MLKNIIWMSILLMMGAQAYAEVVSDIDVHVRVVSKFELSVDRTFIDFEDMDPGEMKAGVPESGIRVSAKSNSGRPWYLTLNTVRELTNGSDFIPNENFFWFGWKAKGATGKFYGEKQQLFTHTPSLVYVPSPDEYNNLRKVETRLEGTDVFLKFGLRVPFKQNSGEYHTVVRFTMTE